jgi:gamma-glutamyltranspeptidase/glutathione hydrolase
LHRFARLAATLAAFNLLAGCGLSHQVLGTGNNASLGQTQVPRPIFGEVVADEPQAALAAKQILNAGGNAADAAAAAGFALSVTLPSRAGLGGGGACIIKMPDASGNPQPAISLLFPPAAPAAAGGARPAAVPTLARGLLALQARYGLLPAARTITPAERLATGSPVSPALEADLTVVGAALLADPPAAAVFGPNGAILPTGANLAQPDLAATLETLRVQNVAGISSGLFAQNFTAAANQAGANLSPADLESATPHYVNPAASTAGDFVLAMLPVTIPASRTLPASAAFLTLDKNGGAVACAVTMNNLFGTGRIAAGTGILLAASPRPPPPPQQLAAGIAYTPGSLTFRAAATGTGQQGALLAAATALANATQGHPTIPVPNPGRANVITCPGDQSTCTATADPRGHGLAIGGN